MPSVDPNCQANKPPLERNEDCVKPGQESAPLTKARLEKIGRYYGVPGLTPEKRNAIPPNTPQAKIDEREEAAFRARIGNEFERNILRSIQSSPIANLLYRKIPSDDFFVSHKRSTATNGAVKNSTPDLIGPIFQIDYRNDVPKFTPFFDSSLIEIKGTSLPSLKYSYDNYQTAGLFDRALNSSANTSETNPAVTFITLSKTKIGRSILKVANTEGIAVFQAEAEENCSSPGFIKVGKTNLLNPKVLKGKPAAEFGIPSELVEFRREQS